MPAEASLPAPASRSAAASQARPRAARNETPSAPAVRKLASGLTAIVQRVPLSPAIYVGAMLPGTRWNLPAQMTMASPVRGYSALGLRSAAG